MARPIVSKVKLLNKNTGKVITLVKTNYPKAPIPYPRGQGKVARRSTGRA